MLLQKIKNNAFTIAVIEFFVVIILFVMYKRVTNVNDSSAVEEDD